MGSLASRKGYEYLGMRSQGNDHLRGVRWPISKTSNYLSSIPRRRRQNNANRHPAFPEVGGLSVTLESKTKEEYEGIFGRLIVMKTNVDVDQFIENKLLSPSGTPSL